MSIKQENVSVLSISSLPGHGNPFSAYSIARLLAGTSVILSGLPQELAKRKHKEIHSKSPTEKKLENYDRQRSGLAGIAYGMMSLVQLINSEIRSHKADVGIFVQEHLLSQVPDWMIRRWFPKGAFFAIPDVLPKQSGIDVLENKKDVKPIVWNRQAFEKLKRQGLRPLLVAPFLSEGFVGEVDFQDKGLRNKIVVKSSGSGMPELWIDQLIKKANEAGLTIEIWLPDKKITVLNGEKTEQIFDESMSLDEYGKRFYQSLVDEPPKFLVSYPSEMVQVASWMRGRGWLGNFLTLPPSGLHEAKNQQWAVKFLQVRQIDFDENTPFNYQEISNEQIEKLRDQLGERSIKDVVIENQRTGLFDNPNKPWVNRYMSENDKRFWQKVAAKFVNEYLQKGEKIDYFQTLNSEEQTRIIELVFRFYEGENKEGLLEQLLIKFLIKKYRDPDNNSSQITTNNDEYKQIESYKKINDAFEFGFQQIDSRKITERLFAFLENDFDFIRSFYVDSEGKDYKRKVNEGLYIRHILRTMVNADLLYQQLKSKNKLPDGFDYETMMWVAALHDSIEISQKYIFQLTQETLKEKLISYELTDEKAEKISQLVLFLTPQKTDGKNGKKTFDEKKQDFDKVWDGEGLDEQDKQWWQANQIYLRLVKAADVLANLFETADDIKNGREDGKMSKALDERFEQFRYRVERIKSSDFSVFDAENWLEILSKKLSEETQSLSGLN